MSVITLPTPVVSADKTIAQIASGTLTSGTQLSLTSLTAYDTLKLRVSGVTSGSSYSLNATINGGSASTHDWVYFAKTNNLSDYSEFNKNSSAINTNVITLNSPSNFNSNTDNHIQIDFYNCKSTGFTTYEWTAISRAFYSTAYQSAIIGRGVFKTAAAVSSLQLNTDSAFTAGNYVLLGG